MVKNVAHVSVAGVAAAWYFDTQEEKEKPLRASLRRALTSSFGSICLGSLLVGLLRTLNVLGRSIGAGQRHNGTGANLVIVISRAVCTAYTGLFSHILPYFNQYAFTQIAIYGLSYTAAAKASYLLRTTYMSFRFRNLPLILDLFMTYLLYGVGTTWSRLGASVRPQAPPLWLVISKTFLDRLLVITAPLISNSVLVTVISAGAIWCGAIAAVFGVLIAYMTPAIFETTITTDEYAPNEFTPGFLPVWFVAFACFFLGIAVSLPAIEAVEATVTAIFVCYGRAPEYLEMRRPVAFRKVEEALEILANEEDDDDEYEYEDEDGEGGTRRAGDDEYEYESDEGP